MFQATRSWWRGLDGSTQAALREINRDFYSRRADDFDRTRHSGGWPGWRRVVQTAAQATDRPLRVLDLGCGNGRFALFLARNPELRRRRPFTYVGIDLSPELIARARTAADGVDEPEDLSTAEERETVADNIRFRVDDIEKHSFDDAAHDLVTLFGVLHHLPSFDSRRRTLERAAAAVAPSGLLALTCWQFVDDPRFANRRLDWTSEAGIDPAELEAGDHLLRWGPTDSGARRYCHHTDEPELDRLAANLPLAEVSRYRADGPGNRQNLYWLGTPDRARYDADSTTGRPEPGPR